MHITIVSPIYPETEKPDLKRDTSVLKYYVRDWNNMGHEVRVLHPYRIPAGWLLKGLCDRDRNKVFISQDDGTEVYLTQMQLMIPHKYVPFEWQQKIAAKKVKRCLEKNGAEETDVFIAHFPLTNIRFCEGVVTGKNSLCVLHKSDVMILEAMKEKKRKKTIARLHNLFGMVCMRSEALKKRALKIGAVDENALIISSGIDDNLINTEEAIDKKIEKGFNKPLKLVFAGNLVKQKAIDDIIKALAIIKEKHPISLTIIGDGEEEAELRLLAKKLNIENDVIFTGRVEREEVSEYMYEADVFAMLSQNETFGLVYLEAMAQGSIAIGTRGDGLDGIILDGENGYLLEPKNPQLLANKIIDVINTDELERARIIKNGYKTVSKMTSEVMSDKYLTVIATLKKQVV